MIDTTPLRVYLSILAAARGVPKDHLDAWQDGLAHAGFTVVTVGLSPKNVDYGAMMAAIPTCDSTVAIIDDATGTAGECEVRSAASGQDMYHGAPWRTWRPGPLLVWPVDGRDPGPWLVEPYTRLPNDRTQAIDRAVGILRLLRR